MLVIAARAAANGGEHALAILGVDVALVRLEVAAEGAGLEPVDALERLRPDHASLADAPLPRAHATRVHRDLQPRLRLPALLELGARLLEQPGVVHRHRGPRGEAGDELLVLGGEAPDVRVSEEEPAQHRAVARNDRDRQVAAHGEVSLRHAAVRLHLAVAGILRDVVAPHHTLAVERRPEYGRVARHGKARERLTRHARQGVEHVRLAVLVEHVVEEGAELRTAHRRGLVGDDLHDALEVALAREGSPEPVETLGDARSPGLGCGRRQWSGGIWRDGVGHARAGRTQVPLRAGTDGSERPRLYPK